MRAIKRNINHNRGQLVGRVTTDDNSQSHRASGVRIGISQQLTSVFKKRNDMKKLDDDGIFNLLVGLISGWLSATVLLMLLMLT